MPVADHDTLVRRLSMILVKLNQGEALEPKALAQEFNVHLRTIQRDLRERFSYLPMEQLHGKYRLDPAFLGKLTLKDVGRFAALAGVQGLFPGLSDEFLRELFDSRVHSSLMVKGHHYEDLRGKEPGFKLLEHAIVARRKVGFEYLGEETSKAYEVEPYKLINNKGVWYLAAKHHDRLKTFSFSKIGEPVLTTSVFTHDPDVDEQLAADDGVWVSDTAIDVVLRVGKAAAGYFKRRKLVANQTIDQELADGSLMLSARVGHVNQILPVVRYWIPHIQIVAPEGWQAELERSLSSYLNVKSGQALALGTVPTFCG
jgi:predicted DNA-binding transcriptional regulator YafY